MNGLINTPKLANIGSFGSLAVALCSVSAVLFIIFNGAAGLA
jgi:hypothetical protein